MKKRFTSTMVAVALVLGTLGVTLAVSPGSASARTPGTYIGGVGDWEDDLLDEGNISASSYARSNVPGMWQAMLWADGYLDFADIDCWFGDDTHFQTARWQANHLLQHRDGIVGPATLREASTRLRTVNGRMTYDGYDSYVTFGRNSSGVWGMYIGDDYRLLSYQNVTFNVCV